MKWRVELAWVLAALVSAGCEGAFTSPPEPVHTEERPFCGNFGELLAIVSRPATVGTGQLVVLTATGGTGRYRWSLSESGSGGHIEEGTGVYVAGERAGTSDVVSDLVLLEDERCQGEATARIEVLPAPTLAPRRVSLRPGETITFRRDGGSDSYRYTVSSGTGASGATIDPETGVYVAGPREGIDVVRLIDDELGSIGDAPPGSPLFAEATVEVSSGAALTLAPDEWAAPVGSRIALPIEGGSSEYTVTVDGTAIALAGDPRCGSADPTVICAVETGTATVTITDAFLAGRVATATVRVVSPHAASRRHPADRSDANVVASGSYDIDGDGFADAVVGMPDASEGWFGSGVVRIHRGRSGGLDPAPARVIAGPYRDEELGRAVAVADLDEDGRVDLLVGARRADALRTDVGALYVYGGVEGGLFSESPSRAWYGQAASDLFGHGVAVCDFNADGHLDVAVAAPFGQEADGESDQGVVQVFLFRADSARLFSSAPDVTLAGKLLVGAEWRHVRQLSFGESIAAGDFDGDGACDLAASATGPAAELDSSGRAVPLQGSSGAVLLHRGRAAAGSDRGGLEAEPSLLWGRADGTDDNSRFGLGLAMGDVNGDGRADVLASRYLHDGAAGTDTGALYVLYGRALDGAATAITDIATADWSVEGGAAQDRMGNAVALVDVDGDGRADILSGDSRAGVMDSERTRPGIVRFWRGGALGVAPTRAFEGPESDARFGLGLGAIGDLDGDHTLELLAFAPFHDTAPMDGDDRGALLFQASLGAAPVPLELSTPSSGQQIGRSVAWIGDLDGDGQPELAVGAPDFDLSGAGINLGVVRIYEGASAAVAQELAGFAGHGEADRFGMVVAPAGDFDGDGVRDLAVLAQAEDLGTLSSTIYDVGAGCDARTNAGAVFVFRGVADGTLESEPAFVIFGPEANQLLDAVAGDVDVNGDGMDDLIIGGYRWDAAADNAGGHIVVHGRPASDRIVAICTPDRRLDGTEANGFRGWAVAGIGDLDRPADGCDEYAVGAPAADPNGRSSAGEVYVVFPACGATAERVVRLYGADTAAFAGASLAGGGVDADGDGVPDLLVGAPRYRSPEGEVGRAIFVSGAYIASRTGSGPLVNPSTSARLVAEGDSPGERLGEAVEWIRHGGVALALLGGPLGAAAGRVDTGGLALYEVRSTGFGAIPRLRMSGEIHGESQLGAAVHALSTAGGAYIAVGAPWSSAGDAYVDDGASYVVTIP